MDKGGSGIDRGGLWMNRSGSGMDQGGLGVYQDGSGMDRGGSGMNRGGSGMHQGGSGMNRGGSGMHQGGSGMDQCGSGMDRGGSGMNRGGFGWILKIKYLFEHAVGQCFVAIDPRAFADGFEDRMSDLIDYCRNLQPADGETEVLVPGDPERKHMAKCDQQGGILYHPNQIKKNELAAKLNVG
ncbi:EIF3A-like protein [Mya arenaria]|uniref:EIF3A-like protein n=1 Tax=Mya arenaria TaxID=6604 RepID=A0ABY7DBL6_MYAAR|nr:EIF3A-like protein [Mya arenaria]